MRGATISLASIDLLNTYFNPRTPCGVRLPDEIPPWLYAEISIHAPHAGCDKLLICAGREFSVFQSTHPMRGATEGNETLLCNHAYFNPRTPCGVRQPASGWQPADRDFNPRTPCGVRRQRCGGLFEGHYISIHAPHAGCDMDSMVAQTLTFPFQSTHPMRGATQQQECAIFLLTNFNPRTPCGVRLFEFIII